MGLKIIRIIIHLMIGAIISDQAFCSNNNSSIATHIRGCNNQSCGGLEIPFPFGLDKGCYMEPPYLFQIYCKTSGPNLFMSDFKVRNISVLDGEVTIMLAIAKDCYSKNGTQITSDFSDFTQGLNGYFSVSFTKNKFYSIGCDNLATVNGYRNDTNYTTGCISSCSFADEIDLKSCSGVGCCQTSIPSDLRRYGLKLDSNNNHKSVWSFNPCSYAFVMQETEFKFSSLEEFTNVTELPLIFDWAVGFDSCEVAKNNTETYACKENSVCVNSTSRSGYLCRCSDGYEGNPYLPNGCIDINECKLHPNSCQNGTCINIPGSFKCSCPKDYTLVLNGTLCSPQFLMIDNSNSRKRIIIYSVLSTALGCVILLIALWRLVRVINKRNKIKRKGILFQRNGGLLLQQQLSTSEFSVEKTKLFNSEELEKSTNNFDKDRILGQGGQGTVYKGMLTDGRIVAVKKSKIDDEGKIAEFINEVVILSQINHRNVVKLLGCCLETEVPLLVYEFIPNGTLAHYLHDHKREFQLTWIMRLRIATEIAGALFYLHYATSTPIYHRDIKSSNILLDEKYKAKVADFGTSKTVEIDQTHVTTLIYGTFGYLDPEYFQSSQFTDKSDVYSFGVVLVELLTGEKAISITRSKEGKSLATYFLISMEENRLFEIVDTHVINESQNHINDQIMAVANLAKKCLNLNGKMRPTMKEVSVELERIQMANNADDYSGPQKAEEIEYIRTEQIEPWDFSYATTSTSSMNYASPSTMVELPLLSSETH
ncbi:putative wall-associated receptor kinase-like 16 isoform X1 [Humulus lupulus]|uniref:putative wall-associated receptor kinase-like 16 isoform X1 n=1 Tax=Humulus lupulus TaxID=3486 RepID=UPI002B40957F|nr:putative wall-associated receptor kinase-like 16 isoform X1 [Humulus lupulus]